MALENSPTYVESALAAGLDVAVDVVADLEGKLWLDGLRRYEVDMEFLCRDCIWIMGSADIPFNVNRIIGPDAEADDARSDSLCIMVSCDCDRDCCCCNCDCDVPSSIARARDLAGSAMFVTICSDHVCGPWSEPHLPPPLSPLLRVAVLYPDTADNLIRFAAIYVMSHLSEYVRLFPFTTNDMVGALEDIRNMEFDLVCVKRSPEHLPEFGHLLPPANDSRHRIFVPSRNRYGGVNPDLAIGTMDSMRIYSGATHPTNNEYLLKHLRAAGVVVEEFEYESSRPL